MEKFEVAMMFNNLKIKCYALRYLKVALREISVYRKNRDLADEHLSQRLIEKYFSKLNIYKLDQTKRRLNYNLAHHFRK